MWDRCFEVFQTIIKWLGFYVGKILMKPLSKWLKSMKIILLKLMKLSGLRWIWIIVSNFVSLKLVIKSGNIPLIKCIYAVLKLSVFLWFIHDKRFSSRFSMHRLASLVQNLNIFKQFMLNLLWMLQDPQPCKWVRHHVRLQRLHSGLPH